MMCEQSASKIALHGPRYLCEGSNAQINNMKLKCKVFIINAKNILLIASHLGCIVARNTILVILLYRKQLSLVSFCNVFFNRSSTTQNFQGFLSSETVVISADG